MKDTTLCYIERDGSYLMMFRNKKKRDASAGKWIGVGGHVEYGETPEQCIEREVKEETGLTLTHYQRRAVIYFYSDTWEDERMYLYYADGFTGELSKVCEEGELKWIPIEDIGELSLWEGDRIFLKELIKGTPYFDLTLRYEGEKLESFELNL